MPKFKEFEKTKNELKYLENLDMQLIFKTYESIVGDAGAQGVPENLTQDNIKELYQLKAQLVNETNGRLTNTAGSDDVHHRLKVQETQFASMLSLIGGFEGLSNILSEMAIMKQEIKALKAKVPQ